MFEQHQQWLARQPGMNPWEEGCQTLGKRIDQWLYDYSTSVCDRPVTREHDAHPLHFDRIWQCWSHHWKQAVEKSDDGRVDGSDVAARIQSGRGYLSGGRLGGDPLRDVVLAVAVAMARKEENRPIEQFQTDYFGLCKGLAAKQNARFLRDPDEWWNDFLDFLAGYTRPPGKLQRFFGRCALKNWLPPVLWNFLRRRPLPQGGEPDERPDDQTPVDQDASQRESVSFFAEIVAQALDGLSRDESRLLSLLFVEQLPGKQVGRILRIHSGTVGRRRDRALENLRRRLSEAASGKQGEQAYRDCLDSLMERPIDFAQALFEALSKFNTQQDPS